MLEVAKIGDSHSLNNLRLIVTNHLREIHADLVAQGMRKPTLRSAWYVLLDKGLIRGSWSYNNLIAVLSKARDHGQFPYGLFSDEAGTDYRGFLPSELERYIENVRDQNTPPELSSDGVLRAVLVEKAGLVPFMRDAVHDKIPVGSPSGNIRKEWAYSWIRQLQRLMEPLGATELEVVYVGDYDPPGLKIRDIWKDWSSLVGFKLSPYAVTEEQARQIGKGSTSLHADGYIVLVGPKTFAQRLRNRLLLEVPA